MIEQITQTRVGISCALRGRVLYPQERAGTKTHGEMAAAVGEGINRFEQDYMGRGPKGVHAHLIGDLLVVRLTGVLTAAEQHLAQSHPVERGRDLIKQVRRCLVEAGRPILEAMIEEATGVTVVSLHYDISTITGEEAMLFALAESPSCRQPRNK